MYIEVDPNEASTSGRTYGFVNFTNNQFSYSYPNTSILTLGRSGDYSKLINSVGVVPDPNATYFADPRTINVTASGNLVQWTNGTMAPASDVVVNAAEVNGILNENTTPALLTDVATLSAVPVFLGTVFNTVGITDDGNASAASSSGFDSNSSAYPTGNSLSSAALHVMNGTVNWQGQSFVLGASGVNDVDSLGGTGINLPAGQFGTMLILGASINNNSSYPAQFTVGYTDGTQTPFTQKLSDWTGGPGGPGTTGSNESIAATMTYYNSAINGTQNASRYLYGYSFAIDPKKTVSYLLVSNNNNLKVLAIDLVKQTVGSAAPVVVDPGFEAVVQGNGGYAYNPTDQGGWTFTPSSNSGGSGVSGNNSPFTGSIPAPQGVQVAFLQSNATMSQSINFPTAGTYQLSFQAIQRANNGSEDFQLQVDGVPYGSFTPGTASYSTYTTSPFTVTAGTHKIAFVGLDSARGDHTALLDNVSIAASSAVTAVIDPGFEANPQGNGVFNYNPSDAPWTFSGNSGLSGNGSDFTRQNPNAPQGAQVAFIQGTSSFSQAINFAAGIYQLTFLAAQRYNYGSEAIQIQVDGVSYGLAFTPAGIAYSASPNISFTVAAGVHTITFLGVVSDNQDHAVFLDAVTLLGDPGFESKSVGTGQFLYSPTGSAWTFSANNSGLSGNGSGFTNGNPNAPQGAQVAFIQGTGTISQAINFAAGTYQLSFLASQRYNYGSEAVQVQVDGVSYGTAFTPAGIAYSSPPSAISFTVAAGVHTITFLGVVSDNQDHAVFLDAVSIVAMPTTNSSATPTSPMTAGTIQPAIRQVQLAQSNETGLNTVAAPPRSPKGPARLFPPVRQGVGRPNQRHDKALALDNSQLIGTS